MVSVNNLLTTGTIRVRGTPRLERLVDNLNHKMVRVKIRENRESNISERSTRIERCKGNTRYTTTEGYIKVRSGHNSRVSCIEVNRLTRTYRVSVEQGLGFSD